jgi:antitoxin (DNA-binding transcriptional repressor) of toxin-antitoxin stability system
MKRLAVVVLGVALTAGCTGVPSSSAPETIEALDTGGASPSLSRPPHLDGDPRTIVESFLDANVTNTGNHTTARAYLTPAASSQWSDVTATIIANDYSVSTYNERKRTVTVFGRVLGRLNAFGIYTPSLLAAGGGGEKVPFVFDIVQAGAQWRIAKPQAGLLLSDEQFRDTYRQRVLYFYDLAEVSLVPDLRWSSLDDRTQLAEWLLTQIVNGPRPELQNAVSADTMPARADARHIAVDLGTPTRIEIPGSSELDAGVRDRLAAQLSQTLLETLAGREMTITDGGSPVLIPAAASDRFTSSDFPTATGPPAPESKVYYLDSGQIRDESGKPPSGAIGDDSVFLNSFAISRPQPGGPLLVAGVTGSGISARLEVGTERGGLHPTSVQGALSRPSFAPGRNEVWVGAGSLVYRVNVSDASARAQRVPIPAVSGGGQVVAVRLSPEGSRIAIVVSGAGDTKQLYVGSIVRGAGPVRVDSLDPISPEGVVVNDVAWVDSFKLFGIGYLLGSQDSKTFETGVDGTDWTNSSIGNLPGPPDSVTAATGSSVWVSASDYVWKQSGSSWVSPGPTGQTPGSAPVYLE